MIRWFGKPSSSRPEISPSPPHLSRRFAVRPQNSRYESLEETGQTISSLFGVPAAPVLVRLIFFNDLDAPWTLDGAAIALTSMAGDGIDPLAYDGAPDPALWRRVTFAHGGANRDPVELPDRNQRYSLTLTANPREAGQPELFFSDWTPIDGPNRTDGAGALMLVRAYSRERMRYAGCAGPSQVGITTPSHGHILSGDATSTPFSGASRRNDRVFACYGVECVSAQEVATVVAIGDSILHGSCSSGELSGPVARACVRASTPDRLIAFFNESYPGRNSVGYHSNGARVIEALRPRVAVIQTWSQNEEWSRDAADRAFARALALADFSIRRGCTPVLTTPAPVFQGQPEFDAHRAHNADRVRAAGRRGLRVLDLEAIWGSGSQPNAYRAEFDCGDGMHANDLGCEEAAKPLAILIKEILAAGG